VKIEDTAANERARLAFRDGMDAGDAQNLLVLSDDGNITLIPSPTLRVRFIRTAGKVARQTSLWGPSLVVGLSALGALSWVKDRRGLAGFLFAAAGLSGVGAASLKRIADGLPEALTAPVPLDLVTLEQGEGGALIVGLGKGPTRLALTLEVGQFDTRDADAFLQAVAKAREASGTRS